MTTLNDYEEFKQKKWEEYLDEFRNWSNTLESLNKTLRDAINQLDEFLADSETPQAQINDARAVVASARIAVSEHWKKKPLFIDPFDAWKKQTGWQPPNVAGPNPRDIGNWPNPDVVFSFPNTDPWIPKPISEPTPLPNPDV